MGGELNGGKFGVIGVLRMEGKVVLDRGSLARLIPCEIDGRMVVLLGVAQHIAGYGRIGMKISIPLAFPFCLVERPLIETDRV